MGTTRVQPRMIACRLWAALYDLSVRETVVWLAALLTMAIGAFGSLVLEAGGVELGPLSSWVAATVTLAAVWVALSNADRADKRSAESLEQSRKSLDLASETLKRTEIRAEADRLYNMNRESSKAVAEMLAKVDLLLPSYQALEEACELPGEGCRVDQKALLNAVGVAASAAFYARAGSRQPDLDVEIVRVHTKLVELRERVRSWQSKADETVRTTRLQQHVQPLLDEINADASRFIEHVRDYLPTSQTESDAADQRLFDRAVEQTAREEAMKAYLGFSTHLKAKLASVASTAAVLKQSEVQYAKAFARIRQSLQPQRDEIVNAFRRISSTEVLASTRLSSDASKLLKRMSSIEKDDERGGSGYNFRATEPTGNSPTVDSGQDD